MNLIIATIIVAPLYFLCMIASDYIMEKHVYKEFKKPCYLKDSTAEVVSFIVWFLISTHAIFHPEYSLLLSLGIILPGYVWADGIREFVMNKIRQKYWQRS